MGIIDRFKKEAAELTKFEIYAHYVLIFGFLGLALVSYPDGRWAECLGASCLLYARMAILSHLRPENIRARERERERERAAQHQALLWEEVNSDDFLRGYPWTELRYKVLRDRGRKCECCGATRDDGVKMNVDHIRPRKDFPDLALDEANLQVLCEVCNQGKGNWDQTDWRPEAQD